LCEMTVALGAVGVFPLERGPEKDALSDLEI